MNIIKIVNKINQNSFKLFVKKFSLNFLVQHLNKAVFCTNNNINNIYNF